jgi:hypothetical protein
MPRGRKPLGEKALTATERTRRYNERHPRGGEPIIRYRRPRDRRSQHQRWHDAVAELQALQGHYASWLSKLPVNLRNSSLAARLAAIRDLDLSELKTLDLPRAFGK